MDPTPRAPNATRSGISDEADRLKGGDERFVDFSYEVEVAGHESAARVKLDDCPTDQHRHRPGALASRDKTTNLAQQDQRGHEL